jgi:hypothetical protein
MRFRLGRLIFGLRSLPLSFSALDLLFGDGEHVSDGIVEALGFRVAGDGWCRLRHHIAYSVAQIGFWLTIQLRVCMVGYILNGAAVLLAAGKEAQ